MSLEMREGFDADTVAKGVAWVDRALKEGCTESLHRYVMEVLVESFEKALRTSWAQL